VERLADATLRTGVKEKEKVFREGFERIQARWPELVKEVRGRGLILGVQLTQDPSNIVKAARERGLLVITAGENTLRFVPSLVMSEEEIREGLGILEKAFEAATEA
jgi:acetylornithine aminotransferase